MRLTEFRPIPGYEGIYEINPLGMVWSIPRVVQHARNGSRRLRGAFLAPSGGGRYPQVQLFRSGRKTRHYLHHLVAEIFLGPRPEGHEVCHNDGNARNFAAANLRYDTRIGNEADKDTHGTRPRGEQSPASTLTEADVRAIHADGGRQREIASRYGVSQSRVSAIKNGKSWSHLGLKEAA